MKPLPKSLAVAAVLLPAVWSSGCGPPEWESMLQDLERQYPDVAVIKPAELHAWLEDSSLRPPLLLDVRQEKEFEVSHLPGAQRLEPGTLPVATQRGLAKDTSIVTYCSVGYRSSEAARDLMQAGYTNVRQLEGSIFGWANQGYKVVRGYESVDEVHPYNRAWGRFLEEEYHPE